MRKSLSGRTTTAWSGCSSFCRLQGQLTSWLRELSQYHMVMQHRHCNTDALSQMPVFPWRLRNRGGGRCRDFCQTRIIALPPPRLGTEICQLSMSEVVLGNVLGGELLDRHCPSIPRKLDFEDAGYYKGPFRTKLRLSKHPMFMCAC